MTIKEKSERISRWCANAQECYCVTCALKNRKTCYSYDGVEEEKIVEENYDIIFGHENNSTGQNNSVNHPEHYQGKNECIDVMLAMFGKEAVKHFCMCNAYKYRYRADRKNGHEDIEKAEWYETKLMELGGYDD